MGPLIRPLLFRVTQGLVVAVAVATLTFWVVAITPGDLALRIAAARHGIESVTPEMAEQIRVEEGLGEHALVRYFRWLGRTLRFDLGRSLVTGRPVAPELMLRFAYTFRLAAFGLLVSFLLALPAGVLSGIRRGGRIDLLADLASGTLCAMPSFMLGVVLILLFALHLQWLPVAGFSGMRHLILPGLTLGIGLAAVSNRIVANAVADVQGTFYYRYARMKGLGEFQIILRHGTKNAAIPVLTLLGLQFAHLLDGAVVVETLFAWPGIGRFLLEGILARDIPVVQGAGILMGCTYAAVNMTVDILCAMLSPVRNPPERIP